MLGKQTLLGRASEGPVKAKQSKLGWASCLAGWVDAWPDDAWPGEQWMERTPCSRAGSLEGGQGGDREADRSSLAA